MGKKVLLAVMVMIGFCVFAACGENTTGTTTVPAGTTSSTSGTTSSPLSSSTTSSSPDTTLSDPPAALSQAEVDAMASETVSLSLLNTLSAFRSDQLTEELIPRFQELYPNVTITVTRHLTIQSLLAAEVGAIFDGNPHDLVLTDPLGIVRLSQMDALEELAPYADSQALLGENPVGKNLDDFVEPLLAQSYDLGEGTLESLPLYTSCPVVYVNRTLMKNNRAALQAAGYAVSAEGFLTPGDWTFSSLSAMRSVFSSVDTLLYFDVPMELFLQYNEAYDAPFFEDGKYVLNNPQTISALQELRRLRDAGILHTPEAEGQGFSSPLFTEGNLPLALSLAPARNYFFYQITPQNGDNAMEGDILPSPRVRAGSYEAEGEEGSSGIVFQGWEGAVCKMSTPAEKFFSWLFLRFLTEGTLNGNMALNVQLLPAVKADRIGPLEIGGFSGTYDEFLQIAVDYRNAEANPGWSESDPRWEMVYDSMIQHAYQDSLPYFMYEPLRNPMDDSIDDNRSDFGDLVDDVLLENTSLSTLLEDFIQYRR